MKSAIISVGTELLFGQIVNTNTVYLSDQLNLLGVDVLFHHSVGDNPQRLKEVLEIALKESSLIITTGGLGPTQDDLTKEVVAEVMHDTLVLHQPSMDRIEEAFNRMGRNMTENNKKQAWLPSRATIFENLEGTAPGFALEENGRTIICLPGPPREMKSMFQKQAFPFLRVKSPGIIYHRMIRTFGIGESQAETSLLSIINGQNDPTVATYAKEGETAIRIASKRDTMEEAKAATEEMILKMKALIGEYIYSTENEELVEVVGKKLLKDNISISCAESCTGGLFAGKITEIPGISAVFDRGIVTYSNRAKIEELGVKEATIDKYGAVSKETAIEMAQGLRDVSGSHLCISVTGVAGPDGGTQEKPVGLVHFALTYRGDTIHKEIRTRNVNRTWNRNYTVLAMLDFINKIIDSN
jgi:nicotinamide-nucleotide amidase